MKYRFYFLGILAGSLFLLSCQSTEADLLSFDIQYDGAECSVDREGQEIYIQFPDTTRMADGLIPEFSLAEGAVASVEGSPFISGITPGNFEAPFTLCVESEDGSNVQEWTVRSFNESFVSDWGLGGFLSYTKSLNRDYDWYIDQSQTGTYSAVNCAPSSMVMAGKWADPEFPFSVEDIRQWYNREGGGFTAREIDSSLSRLQLDYHVMELGTRYEVTRQLMAEQIENGNILILGVDLHYLPICKTAAYHVGKYYTTFYLATGHCIVVKGYKIVDGEYFFEVYDPIGYNFKYADGSYKGVDRYQRAINLYTATFCFDNNAFVISPG